MTKVEKDKLFQQHLKQGLFNADYGGLGFLAGLIGFILSFTQFWPFSVVLTIGYAVWTLMLFRRLRNPDAKLVARVQALVAEAEEDEERRNVYNLRRRCKEKCIDPRIPNLLDELEALRDAFRRGSNDVSSEVARHVQKVFRACTRALEESLELRTQARRLPDGKVRERFVQKSDVLVRNVETASAALAGVLVSAQDLRHVGNDTDNDVRAHLDDLEQSLRVMQEVDREFARFSTNMMSHMDQTVMDGEKEGES